MDVTGVLRHHLSDDGRLLRWPKKREPRRAALIYLASRFTPGRDYTEKEVNEILTAWHCFSDPVVLRRELIDAAYLRRTPNGGRYWREEPPQEAGQAAQETEQREACL